MFFLKPSLSLSPSPLVLKIYRMGEAPTLISLCMEAIKNELLRGDDILLHVYDLPSYLFDILLTRLPPLALQKLQEELPFKSSWSNHESTDDCFRNGRKRGRDGNFNTAWRRLFKSRWPDFFKQFDPADCLPEQRVRKCDLINDWQQMYWETHMQDCIDEAAEIALLPSFDGCIGEIIISDDILKFIGYKEHMSHSTRDYSKLSNHCQQFANYARCLRLQNVLCSTETCHLIRNSKLQSLILRRIKSKEHVDGLCKLLSQNSEALRSLEFINCKLSSNFVNAICDSLQVKSMQTHMVQHFSVKASSFLETNLLTLPIGLISFLSSGRSLCSLTFSDNRLRENFAKMVFNTLLDASSSLVILDLSENNISGWLSNFNRKSPSFPSSSIAINKSLQSLRVLNLRNVPKISLHSEDVPRVLSSRVPLGYLSGIRGNNIQKTDVDSLVCALYHVPNLDTLDISDNPIEDDGIRTLIPYFVEASQRHSPLADLKFENCELSCNGVTQLLEVLLTLENPIDSLSIADNDLGSQVAAILGKFLATVKVLNIELIGLGSSGFLELEHSIGKDVKLVYINISKNRGGIATAKFLSRLMPWAQQLVGVNAAYNFIPVESLTLICSALRVAKGKLEHLDLTGNARCNELDYASMVAEFQHNNRPIVILPSLAALNAPYDDDP